MLSKLYNIAGNVYTLEVEELKTSLFLNLNKIFLRKAVEYLDDESIDSEVEVPIDRFLLPKPVFNLLEARVKAFNNMAQVLLKYSNFSFNIVSRAILKSIN